jgi:hypothetical protein
MRTILTALAMLLAFSPVGFAQEATQGATDYRTAVKACGAEWRKRDDYETRKGRDAWNEFRAECVVRQGYVSKKEQAKVAKEAKKSQ